MYQIARMRLGLDSIGINQPQINRWIVCTQRASISSSYKANLGQLEMIRILHAIHQDVIGWACLQVASNHGDSEWLVWNLVVHWRILNDVVPVLTIGITRDWWRWFLCMCTRNCQETLFWLDIIMSSMLRSSPLFMHSNGLLRWHSGRWCWRCLSSFSFFYFVRHIVHRFFIYSSCFLQRCCCCSRKWFHNTDRIFRCDLSHSVEPDFCESWLKPLPMIELVVMSFKVRHSACHSNISKGDKDAICKYDENCKIKVGWQTLAP
mmetsp:Transcript_30526/g.73229  ORF Transcript_30526/g.73229 Transcript_30526/m.73229 type:complete len:263 (-) Transcript_30526:142-930(-)